MKNLLFILISILLISCEKEEVIKDNGYIHFSNNKNESVIMFENQHDFILNGKTVCLNEEDFVKFNLYLNNLVNAKNISNTYCLRNAQPYDYIYKILYYKNNKLNEIILVADCSILPKEVEDVFLFMSSALYMWENEKK